MKRRPLLIKLREEKRSKEKRVRERERSRGVTAERARTLYQSDGKGRNDRPKVKEMAPGLFRRREIDRLVGEAAMTDD